jgi:hypothetical protein
VTLICSVKALGNLNPQRRTALMLNLGLQTRGETELNLGRLLGGLEN